MTEQQDAPLVSSEPDTEGHLQSYGVAQEEDTEGHLRVPAPLHGDDDEDVEGHRIRPGRTVEPSFDEDGLSEH